MIGEWMHTMDDSGLTPLDRVYQSNHLELAELMLRVDKEARSQSLEDSTPLHRAALLGLTDAVSALVRYGSDPMARDGHGETPLHKAAREGQVGAVRALAEVSDVNCMNHLGLTPLHWAAITGRADVAAVLLEHGADPAMNNAVLDGMNSRHLAQLMGYDALAGLLGRHAGFV